MSNVITFPAQRSGANLSGACAGGFDIRDAFAVAAILFADLAHQRTLVNLGFKFVGIDGYPPLPMVRFCGREVSLAAIAEMALCVTEPVPPFLVTTFAMILAEEPAEFHLKHGDTYATAAESLLAYIDELGAELGGGA
jgi:hypothetical protein